MKGEVNVSQAVPEDVCVCLCVCVCVCVCVRVVEAVSFIGLGSMEDPGDYITREVSGNVCVHVCK